MLFPFASSAQKEITVVAEYEYIMSENQTIEQAKLTALDRAKIKAIEEAFGTIVTQENTTLITNSNSQVTTDFISVGGSHIKGEWVETIEKPCYEIIQTSKNIIIKVRVIGRIREIIQESIDLDIKVLCNGIEEQNERTDFYDGDQMYIGIFRKYVNNCLSI